MKNNNIMTNLYIYIFFFWGGGGGGGLGDGNRYGLKEPCSPTLRCAPTTLKSPFSVAPETRDSVTDQ